MNRLADVPSLAASSPRHSAGILSPWQRTVLVAHTEVQRRDQGGRAERDMLCHLATVTRFFSFGFCRALLTSHPNSILFPQLDITCRQQVKIQGAAHSQSVTGIGFSVPPHGSTFEKSFSHTSKSALLVREVQAGQVLAVVFSCAGRTAPQLTISTSSRAN